MFSAVLLTDLYFVEIASSVAAGDQDSWICRGVEADLTLLLSGRYGAVLGKSCPQVTRQIAARKICSLLTFTDLSSVS